MKKFIYLIQSDEEMPYPDLPAASCDVILLTWKTPVVGADTDAVFYPDSTWNEGRNRLLYEAVCKARETGNDYLYYIFLDGDCRIQEDRDLAERLGIPLTGNPFRTFEHCLVEWMPALGYTRYDWQYVAENQAVNLGYNIDALMNAFHRDTIDILLPYYIGFDAESWLYSQHLINHLTAMLYNEHRIQFNVIRTKNRARQGYGIRKKYWHIPTTFLYNAVGSGLRDRMRTEDPNSIQPAGGQPKKGNGTYRLPDEFRSRHFDETHPFFRFRTLDNATPRPPRRLSEQEPIAVCFSGKCTADDRALASIRTHLLDRIGPHDIFAYLPDTPDTCRMKALNPTMIKIARDQPIDEKNLVDGINCRLKSGVQAYLQQLHGLARCDALRKQHERSTGVRYGCVIRCRPDLLFLQPVDNIRRLDLNYLYVPDFHPYDGCNDRFAVGNPDDMSIYMSKIDSVYNYARDWMKHLDRALPVSAEMFTAGHLRNHNIRVRPLPVRFNRVRDHKVKADTKI